MRLRETYHSSPPTRKLRDSRSMKVKNTIKQGQWGWSVRGAKVILCRGNNFTKVIKIGGGEMCFVCNTMQISPSLETPRLVLYESEKHCKTGTMRLESTTRYNGYPAWGEQLDQSRKGGAVCVCVPYHKSPPTCLIPKLPLYDKCVKHCKTGTTRLECKRFRVTLHGGTI